MPLLFGTSGQLYFDGSVDVIKRFVEGAEENVIFCDGNNPRLCTRINTFISEEGAYRIKTIDGKVGDTINRMNPLELSFSPGSRVLVIVTGEKEQ